MLAQTTVILVAFPLLLTTAGSPTIQTPDARARRVDARISVDLLVQPRLGEGQVKLLQAEAGRIWSRYGVALEWTPQGNVRVFVDTPPVPLPYGSSNGVWPLGRVLFGGDEPSPSIYISLGAVLASLDHARHPFSLPIYRDRVVGRALGRVLAHELAHYLLGTKEHSTTGLLRPSLQPDELVDPVGSGLDLEPQSIARLVERLSRGERRSSPGR